MAPAVFVLHYLKATSQPLMMASQHGNAEEPSKKRRSEEELWRPTEFTPVAVEAVNNQSQHGIDTILSPFLSNGNAGATTSDQKLEEELCVHAAGLRSVEG
jgi:hypothetical protein